MTNANDAEPQHLYVHIPYCVAKCPYCDFNSIAGREDEYRSYVDALITEIERLPSGPYATIFIGGGTPTILPPQLLERLCYGITQHVSLAPNYEWTCEANPGSADADRFSILAAHGVNRLSLGVQSTHDHHLRFLGRVHSAIEADRAIALARAAVPRVSADLIMGLPLQTADELRQDLLLYKRHDLQHASVYHLTYESGTEFYARRSRGEISDIDPTISRQLFELVWDGLETAGLLLYETSNFSVPGQESRHNMAYWLERNYYAVGAGAVSTINGVRTTREKHPAKYITRIMTGTDAVWRTEQLNKTELLTETWMLGLRLLQGVSISRLEKMGDDQTRWRPRVQSLCAEGLLEEQNGYIRLTRAGRPVQDEVTIYLLPS